MRLRSPRSVGPFVMRFLPYACAQVPAAVGQASTGAAAAPSAAVAAAHHHTRTARARARALPHAATREGVLVPSLSGLPDVFCSCYCCCCVLVRPFRVCADRLPCCAIRALLRLPLGSLSALSLTPEFRMQIEDIQCDELDKLKPVCAQLSFVRCWLQSDVRFDCGLRELLPLASLRRLPSVQRARLGVALRLRCAL